MKHAAAKVALVQVALTGNQLSISVEDDGKGLIRQRSTKQKELAGSIYKEG